MEIFMRNVSWAATHTDVVLLIAEHIHHADFMGDGVARPINFHVHLLSDKKYKIRPHSGKGKLTLPTVEIGERFLELYGGSGLNLKGRLINFERSKIQNGPIQLKNIHHVTTTPYRDPGEPQASEEQEETVTLQSIQFGWECRDQVLSIESEASPIGSFVSFDQDGRRFRIQFLHLGFKYHIVIAFSQIESLTAHTNLNEAAAVFTLFEPPTYEKDLRSSGVIPQSDGDTNDFGAMVARILLDFMLADGDQGSVSREQISFLPLPENHEYVAPYASLVLRLVFQSNHERDRFADLSKAAGFELYKHSTPWIVERRQLFSVDALRQYEPLARQLPWCVGSQVEGIVRRRSVDIQEMLRILPDVKRLILDKGEQCAASLLRDFATRVDSLYRDYDDAPDGSVEDAVGSCFRSTVDEYETRSRRDESKPLDPNLFESYHVTVTPTTLLLDGPTPEQSNRVIRAYGPERFDSFLRVTFADESGFAPRYDREVDANKYIQTRIGPIMFGGLEIVGQKFEFLGYSMSSLKEHSVWFVKPFNFKPGGQPERLITAKTIIASLGEFSNLAYDPKLVYCPARYGARVSLAFSATEASIDVDVGEIRLKDDIKVKCGDQEYNHTDGVGTMSTEVAKAIGKAVGRHSSVVQVRIQGAKGMLSTDYTLPGRAIALRRSMIKFDAPTATNIEIAGIFDRPIPYFLNRPLVMLLEGLGVPYEMFKRFQDIAVRETEEAAESLEKAAKLFERHGLGASYHLSSIMNSLLKLEPTISLVGDPFSDKAIEFAKNDVLRALKHKARIPIPSAWALVGVADEHGYLEEGEIYACVHPVGKDMKCLQGDVVISRSPTSHPGDVRIVHARPPPSAPLENCVVFSVKGDRPLPSCLGGGDLDGDLYNLIPLNEPELAGFKPSRIETPATYPPAEKKVLDRPSTMEKDVAQFVMDYLLSDIVGLIGSTWLIMADQATTPERHGIFDPDCITLAGLNSDATDYPRSGEPVDRNKIPKLKRREKPDWSAPETVQPNTEASEKFYESQRAIGRLLRAIDLPAEHNPMKGATRITSYRKNRSKAPRSTGEQAERCIFADGEIYSVIEEHVGQYLPNIHEPIDDLMWSEAISLLARYTAELQSVCITNTLSTARNSHLAEEEALIGTIVAKTSQPHRRKEMTSRLRESTGTLVRSVREDLGSMEHDSLEEYMQRSWYAFSVALEKGRQFGAQSFVWVALGAIFEAIRRIDQRDNESV